MNTAAKKNRGKENTKELARMLAIAGDATRLSILCILFEAREACVSQIAETVGISVATASYHLNKMADNGFFTRHRDGTSICYRVRETPLVTKLEDLICSTL